MIVNQLIILKENLIALQKANEWFCHSFEICNEIENFNELSIIQLDNLENLTVRYARIVDILFNKVFRSLANMEMAKVKS